MSPAIGGCTGNGVDLETIKLIFESILSVAELFGGGEDAEGNAMFRNGSTSREPAQLRTALISDLGGGGEETESENFHEVEVPGSTDDYAHFFGGLSTSSTGAHVIQGESLETVLNSPEFEYA